MTDLIEQGTKDADAAAMHMANQDKDKAIMILAGEVAEWQDMETEAHPSILERCSPSTCVLIEAKCCEMIATECIYKRTRDQ